MNTENEKTDRIPIVAYRCGAERRIILWKGEVLVCYLRSNIDLSACSKLSDDAAIKILSEVTEKDKCWRFMEVGSRVYEVIMEYEETKAQ